jgi:hypothetical protein
MKPAAKLIIYSATLLGVAQVRTLAVRPEPTIVSFVIKT